MRCIQRQERVERRALEHLPSPFTNNSERVAVSRSLVSRSLVQHPLAAQNLAQLRLRSLPCGLGIARHGFGDHHLCREELDYTNAEMRGVQRTLILDGLDFSDETALMDLHIDPRSESRVAEGEMHSECCGFRNKVLCTSKGVGCFDASDRAVIA